MRKVLVSAAAALLGVLATAAPATAATFGFSFSAPLANFGVPNGDVASGSGTLVTDDVDADGHYRFVSATGTFTSYQGSPFIETIDEVSGFAPFFSFPDGYLYVGAGGALVTDGIAFAGSRMIAFDRLKDGSYGGVYGEVGIVGGTLSFSRLAGPVPEPATWAMLLLGFGTLGVALRRRGGASATAVA